MKTTFEVPGKKYSADSAPSNVILLCPEGKPWLKVPRTGGGYHMIDLIMLQTYNDLRQMPFVLTVAPRGSVFKLEQE